MQKIIALDLETTGLDANRDTIIEVGAVRFKGTRVEEEWHSLINPGRPIPPEIVQLTGISDRMVAGAPRFQEVQEDLESFLSDMPVLGHNILFDLQFLQQKNIQYSNPSLDTYDLASVVLPSASQYSLSGLATQLGIPLISPHRALEDAHTTHQVYCRLLDHLFDLPSWVINQIAEHGMRINWGGAWIFEDALDQLAERGEIIEEPTKLNLFQTAPQPDFDPIEPAESTQALEIEELASILEPGGEFAQKLPGYEHRSQQVAMLKSVAEAFSDSRLLLVEAGTGTGKSMAYLIPALAWAETNGERVVISTNTINLQDQLVHKDIPDLCKLLNKDYRTAILKGRSNYLCPNRFSALLQVGPRSPDEIRVLAKVLVWLYRGGNGDRNELSLRGPGEVRVWSSISSDSEDCSMDVCREQSGSTCPYYRAHLEAEHAHVVIVNHALLLADIATGNRVIPEYRYLVVDEAHHLESATTSGLSFRVTDRELIRALRDLGNVEKGILGNILRQSRQNLDPENRQSVENEFRKIGESIETHIELAQTFFKQVLIFLEQRRDGQPVGIFGQNERIVPTLRSLTDWNEIELGWDNLSDPLGETIQQLDSIGEDLIQSEIETLEGLGLALRSILRVLKDSHSYLDEMVFNPDPAKIYWIELRSVGQGITFHAAPLEVGPLIEKHLWHEKESIVMTSATMTTSGNFDYIRNRLNADDADELALGSPFDYENSTLLYLVEDIPEPQDRQAYQRSFENGIKQLALATGGRMLVLFTSYQQLTRTMRAISSPLFAEGILALAQSGGASRHSLLETFKNTEKAVLLGTRSFWEGVDVPGDALSVLAIARLPFDVPTDPIVAARSETFEYPFEGYSIPEAILRYRQGFGRLIRTKSDRGAVVNFDRRLLTKRYGKAFLDSLPECTIRKGQLAAMPKDVVRWLGQ